MKKFFSKIAIISLTLFVLSDLAWAASSAVTETIDSSPPAAGTWTSSKSATAGNMSGFLNVSVYGSSWSATVTLQRTFDNGSNWYDVTTFTSNAQHALIDREKGVRYRIGIKNGEYSSGSVTVRLSN